jgi:hypothetical protein
MPLYIVDTIVTFRHKYAIAAASLEHAYEEVAMRESRHDEFTELTQRYLGEAIADGREIKKDEFDQLLHDISKDKNEWSSHWLGDKLIHKVDYGR